MFGDSKAVVLVRVTGIIILTIPVNINIRYVMKFCYNQYTSYIYDQTGTYWTMVPVPLLLCPEM